MHERVLGRIPGLLVTKIPVGILGWIPKGIFEDFQKEFWGNFWKKIRNKPLGKFWLEPKEDFRV